MKYIKAEFFARYRDKKTGVEFPKKLKGYTNEDGTLGFDKRFYNVWTITDLQTGLFIYARKTRKECAAAYESIDPAIFEKIRQSKEYLTNKEIFENMLKEQNIANN